MDDPGSWCLVAGISGGGTCLVIAALCVAVSLFFSVTSLALRSVSWVRVEEAFEERGRAEAAEALRAAAPRLMYAAATLRLLANLGLLVCVVHYFTSAEETRAVVPLLEAFLASAGILLVFSVAIPRAWARHAGNGFLVRAYPVLRVVQWATWPVTTILGLFDPLVRRLAGVAEEDANGRLEERHEELLSVVDEGQKEGLVDEEEREMIASVLEFREQTAGEVMTPRTDVIGIEADADLATTVEIVISAGHSRFPVYEGSIDKVIGMLYAKDLLRDLNQPDPAPGIRHRLRKAYFVPESKPLRDLLREFKDQQIHLAVVLDEYGGTAGVVTIEDVLEELVGEIEDEYETPKEETMRRLDEYTVEMDGRVHVHDLNDEFDLEIPEDEDYETIGGFVFHRLGSIPPVGETLSYENLHFTVTEVEERKINRLRMVIRPEASAQNGRKKGANADDDKDRSGGDITETAPEDQQRQRQK